MTGSSGLQWSFSNANSQLLSFKSTQEKAGPHYKLQSSTAFSERYPSLEKQGGSHYPLQWQNNEGLSAANNHSTEGRIFSLAAQNTQIVSPASVVPLSNSPVVGSTDLRNSSNISTGPCQLTIFYNGSVCVYDNVSPDKAQAIMLLAGNGEKLNSNIAHSSAPKVQPTVLKQHLHESVISNPSLSFSSSISLVPTASPLPVGQVNAVRPVPVAARVLSSEVRKPCPAVGTPTSMPSAVPQARKASLARFLEKRKERVIGASPYGVTKNTSECSTAGPGGAALAANSANSSPLPAAGN